ncbi:CBS domain-containing protein [Crossiella equi]|uniref:CBS domain-containing protein n=1 Tax=Crossiella equi TaxID=130796 RepID=A0ABS5A5E4_9PSEU|nr:CBS domain-containing protein [Crossiella equi]MBP2471815.1 CBS domain-containing protein [Crossiella equi]
MARARDLMSTPVVCVRADLPLHAAARLLAERGFAALPVLDEDDRLVGMIAECDLLRAHLARGGWQARTVATALTRTVAAVTPETRLDDLAEHLLDLRYRSVPVVDGAALLGIVSRRDLLRALTREPEDTSEEASCTSW